MKLKSVKDLYLVKKIILKMEKGTEEESKKAVQLINRALLREGGTRAVLYPCNSLKEDT